VDRILDAAVSVEAALPLRSLPGYEDGLDLPAHMAEHLYMFAAPPVRVRFRVAASGLNNVFDWFGQTVRLDPAPDGSGDYEAEVRVNERAMRYWALQFYECVEVLEPPSLRESLKAAGRAIARKHG